MPAEFLRYGGPFDRGRAAGDVTKPCTASAGMIVELVLKDLKVDEIFRCEFLGLADAETDCLTILGDSDAHPPELELPSLVGDM